MRVAEINLANSIFGRAADIAKQNPEQNRDARKANVTQTATRTAIVDRVERSVDASAQVRERQDAEQLARRVDLASKLDRFLQSSQQQRALGDVRAVDERKSAETAITARALSDQQSADDFEASAAATTRAELNYQIESLTRSYEVQRVRQTVGEIAYQSRSATEINTGAFPIDPARGRNVNVIA
jgi:hypothetical protein